VSIALNVDAPKWVLRKAASPTTGIDVGYNPDGQPASMHTYHSTIYTHLTDRVMRVHPRFTYPNAMGVKTNDGFHLATNAWDGQGQHSLSVNGSGLVGDSDGNIWTNAFERYEPVAKTWSTPITKRTATFVRFPAAFDSTRRQIFTLQYGDGQGYDKDLGVQASRVPIDGDTQYIVSFNASSAYTQFQNDGASGFLEYIGMDYDAANDRFLVYGGQGMAAGRVYIVQPTAGNQWDMSLMTLGTGSLIPAGPSSGSGIQNRFRYLPALKGFVLLARASDNLYFLRVA
jgi:hypothetical protein